jgi:hypothetical protein
MALVAKQSLHFVKISASLNQRRCKAVPQIMELEILEPCSFQRRTECTLNLTST